MNNSFRRRLALLLSIVMALGVLVTNPVTVMTEDLPIVTVPNEGLQALAGTGLFTAVPTDAVFAQADINARGGDLYSSVLMSMAMWQTMEAPATPAELIITATVGVELATPHPTVTLQFPGMTAAHPPTDADWFVINDIPDGLLAAVAEFREGEALITVTGTPTAATPDNEPQAVVAIASPSDVETSVSRTFYIEVLPPPTFHIEVLPPPTFHITPQGDGIEVWAGLGFEAAIALTFEHVLADEAATLSDIGFDPALPNWLDYEVLGDPNDPDCPYSPTHEYARILIFGTPTDADVTAADPLEFTVTVADMTVTENQGAVFTVAVAESAPDEAAKFVTDLRLVELPDKMEYTAGEELNLDGLEVVLDLVFVGGSLLRGTYVVPYSTFDDFIDDEDSFYGFEIPLYEVPLTVANEYFTITHLASDPQQVYLTIEGLVVKPRTVAGIATLTNMTRMIYAHGDALDLAGLTVQVNYAAVSGLPDHSVVAAADFAARGITADPANGTSLESAHNNTPVIITHTVSGQTTTTSDLTVTPVVTGIEIDTQPAELNYIEGQYLDLDGLVVKLTWSDGVETEVAATDFDTYTTGVTADPAPATSLTVAYHNNRPVTVTHTSTDLTAETDSLTVVGRVVEDIEVTSQPNRLEYHQGDQLDLDGLEVRLTWNDGYIEYVEAEDFDDNGISTNPATSASLTREHHHNEPVEIIHDSTGLTVETDSLTVITVPHAPERFVVAEIRDTGDYWQVELEWWNPEYDQGNPIDRVYVSYRYRVYTPGTPGVWGDFSEWSTPTDADRFTSHLFTGLPANAEIEFRARAVNAVGYGDWGEVVSENYIDTDNNLIERYPTIRTWLSPAITSTEAAVARGGTFEVEYTGSPPIVFKLVDAPNGVTIDEDTGVISVAVYTATSTDLEPHEFIIEATGPRGTIDVSQDFALTVGEVPYFTINPQSIGVRDGAGVTFTVAVTGEPAPTIRWQVNDSTGWVDIHLASLTELALENVTLAMNGNRYRAVATNAVGTATSLYATLTVSDRDVAPEISTPTDVIFTIGAVPPQGPPVFTVEILAGIPTPTIQWQVSTDDGTNWADIAGATGLTLTLTETITLAMDGNLYRAVATNREASVPSAAALLTVREVPRFTLHPESIGVLEGTDVTFTAAVAGTPAPTIQWQVNEGTGWSDIYGATATELTLTNVTVADHNNNQYRAVATSVAGTAHSEIITLEVSESMVVDYPADVTVGVGGRATFTVELVDYPEPESIQWQVRVPDTGAGMLAFVRTATNDGWVNLTEGEYGITGTDEATLTIADVTAEMNGWEFRAVVALNGETWTSESATLTVTAALELPIITTHPSNQSVVAGQTATFTVVASGTDLEYQWQESTDNGETWTDIADALTAEMTLSNVVIYMDGNQYRVVVTNEDGSVNSNAATLTVTPQAVAPTITTHPSDVSAVAGDDATFTVVAAGTAPLTYQWEVNDGSGWEPITGETTATLTELAVTLGMGGNQYRVVVTNDEGSVTSDAATLTVLSPPVFAEHPEAVTALIDRDTGYGTAGFKVIVEGNPDRIDIQWQVNDGTGWADIPGATGYMHSPTDVRFAHTVTDITLDMDGYLFRVVAENAHGVATSTDATLFVREAPVIITQPVSRTVLAGQNATFSIEVRGTPEPTIQWQRSTDDGDTWTNISGATTATLTELVTAGMDGNQFRAVATNPHGTDTSNAATLTVGQIPYFTLHPTPAVESAVVDDELTFTVAVTGVPAPTIQWQRSTDGGDTFVDIDGETSLTLNVTAQLPTGDYDYQYRAVATNEVDGETHTFNSTAVTLRVYATQQAPSITTAVADQTVTAGQNATFSVEFDGVPTTDIHWEVSIDNGATWASASDAVRGFTSTLVVENVQLPSGDYNYQYRAVATNPAGSIYSTATLYVQTVPTVVTQPTDQIVYADGTATFTVDFDGVPVPAILWQEMVPGGAWVDMPGETNTTLTLTNVTLGMRYNQYRAVATNPAGYVESAAATLFVEQAPAFTLHPASHTELMAGGSVTFTVAVTGAPTPTIQWQEMVPGGTWANIAGETGLTLTLTNVTLAMSGNLYRAVATNTRGSATSDAGELTVLSPPVFAEHPEAVTALIDRDTGYGTAGFKVIVEGNPDPIDIQWQVLSTIDGSDWEDIPNATGTMHTLTDMWFGHTVTDITLDMDGYQFRVEAENEHGITHSRAATLFVREAAFIITQPESRTVLAGQNATFSIDVRGTPIPTIQWQRSTDDGDTWTNISGATTATLTELVTAEMDGNQYRAVATNRHGYEISNVATLTVGEVPYFTLHPTPAVESAVVDDVLTFTVAVTGVPAPAIQWQRSTDNGATWDAIDGATAATLTVTAQLRSGVYDYQYRAVATNVIDGTTHTANSTAVTLRVYEAQQAPGIVTEVANQTVTAGQNATFSVEFFGVPTTDIHWEVSIDNGTTWASASDAVRGFTSTLAVENVQLPTGDYNYLYRAVATNPAGSIYSTATLNVQTVPTVVTQPIYQIVYVAETATFTVVFDGVPAPTILWQVMVPGGTWVDMPGETSTTLNLTNVTLGMRYNQYRAVATNPAGYVESAAATLYVEQTPAFTLHPYPASQTELAGGSVTFTVAVTGAPTPTIQWQEMVPGGTWTNITGETGLTLTLNNVTMAMSGNLYRAVATNTRGSATSDAGELTVLSPPVFAEYPEAVTAVVDRDTRLGTAGFKVIVYGNPDPISIQWQVLSTIDGSDWEDIPNATGTMNTLTDMGFVHTVTDITLDMDGYQFRVEATNAHGTTHSRAATLFVREATFIITQPESHAVVLEDGEPGTTAFTVEVRGTPEPTIQWQLNDGTGWEDIDDATGLVHTVTDIEVATHNNNQFRAVVSNAHATVTSDAATLTVWEVPFFTLHPADYLALEDYYARFEVEVRGNPAPAIQWQVSADVGETWADITGATATELTLSNVTMDMYGNLYRAVATNVIDGVTRTTISDEAELTVTDVAIAPEISTPTDVIFTIGSVPPQGPPAFTVEILAGIPTPTIQWQVNDGTGWADIAGATTATLTLTQEITLAMDGNLYRAVATNREASVPSAAALLTVREVPRFTLHPESIGVLEGTDVTFTAAVAGTPAPTIQWQVNDGNGWADIDGATATELTLTNVTVADHNNNQYRAVATSVAGTAHSNIATLTVTDAAIAPEITDPDDETVVEGETATFSVEVIAGTGIPAPTFQWAVNDGTGWVDIPNATGTELTLANVTIGMDGNQYRVVATNEAGSDISAAATLTVTRAPAAPTVITQPEDVEVEPGENAEFTVAFDGYPVPTIQWQRSTDDGETWADIDGATGATLTELAVTEAMSGYQYRAVATNNVYPYTAISRAAMLTVRALNYTVTFIAGDNGHFGFDVAEGEHITELTIDVAPGAVLQEAQIPEPIAFGNFRFDVWTTDPYADPIVPVNPVGYVVDGHVTFTALFVPDAVVDSISIPIHAEPNLKYFVGDALDLTGLVVTLHYTDGTDDEVVFADFGDRGITTTPADGTTLALTHSGYGVRITHTASGEYVYTDPLDVCEPHLFEGEYLCVCGIVWGDANDSGVLDPFDALRILQYLAGHDVVPERPHADANLSGDIDPFDALRILQYLAGHDVVVGRPPTP